MRTIILKNTTVSDILVRGRIIVPSGQRDFSDVAAYQLRLEAGLTSDIASGDIVVNNGTFDLDVASGQEYVDNLLTDFVDTIAGFSNLPASPSTDDFVFYTPFQNWLMLDGTDWVAPKIFSQWFYRKGNLTSLAYLRSGEAQIRPNHGIRVPIQTGFGGYKIYGITISSNKSFTGDIELHSGSTLNNPVFGTTGIGSALSITTSSTGDTTFAGETVTPGNNIQAFGRITGGTIQDGIITVSAAMVAGT